jgi:hypothetical protein
MSFLDDGRGRGAVKEDAVLFVFYKLKPGKEDEKWNYTRMPKGWMHVGSSQTGAVGGIAPAYPSEEQFGGPADKQTQMRVFLHKIFQNLKERKVISKFKIRETYKP